MHLCVRACTVCAHSDTDIMGDFFIYLFFVRVCDRPFSAICLVQKIIIMLTGGSCSESEIQHYSIHNMCSGGSKGLAIGAL